MIQAMKVHTQIFKCQQIESYPVDGNVVHKATLIAGKDDRIEMVFYSSPPFEPGCSYIVTFGT